jgi:hypothetical protein
MSVRARTTPRLIDVCPEFKAALDAFDSACAKNDLESAAKAWAKAIKAARAFRTKVVVLA